MYLQITTKCNMTCAHCCYSCKPGRGKHADYHDILDAISFASDMGEIITIGGGEPTLHPRFFDILKRCLWAFDYVWLATNGSQTETMYRLDRIMCGEDMPNYDEPCTCEEDDPQQFEDYGCLCYEKYDEDDIITLVRNDQLAVALSQDPWHDPIDSNIVDLWMRQKYEIRNVASNRDGATAQGNR